MKVCNVPGCPELFEGAGGRCHTHSLQARRNRDSNRVYGTKGHRTFRAAVLTRDPVCTICHKAMATVADHHPLDRKTLVETGRNPNDPKHGRGLCATCHNTWTAHTTPAGFRTL